MPQGTAKMIIPIIKLLNRYAIGYSQTKGMSTDEVTAYYNAEKLHLDWVAEAVNDPEAPKRFTAVHRAAFTAGHMVDAPRMEKFVKEVIASDSNSGDIALAWQKAVSQGKLLGPGHQKKSSDGFYLALRLIQAEIQGETMGNKSVRGTPAVAEWFRTRIAKKRELEAKGEEKAPKGEEKAPKEGEESPKAAE
jgi:hypothetical protein